MTVRVGEQLVGVRPDTDATADRIRAVFAAWVEPDETVPWAFSLRLETERSGRGPRAVPQLRLSQRLLARSRAAEDVMNALDHVLGGVLARQDDTRRWLGLRTFTVGDRAVLVDASPPALTADPQLTRAGVTELPTWTVEVEGDVVTVPPPLTAESGAGGGAGTAHRLVGLVGLDACSHAVDDPDHDHADHLAAHHPTDPGAVLARFAARHPSTGWFHTVEQLVTDGRVHATTDRTVAADQIRRLLVPDDTPA